MSPYAYFMFAVLFVVLGMMIHAGFEEWMDSRARKARRKAAEQARSSSNFGPDADRSMNEAVALVKDKLGGTIVSRWNNRI